MHPRVVEVGKQCNYMGFFFARKAHIFHGLFYQGYSVVYIKYKINKIRACLVPFIGENCKSP